MESISVSREEVVRFLSIQGYSYGYSYGYGAGHGHGSGFGAGDGSGDISTYEGNIVDYIDGVLTIITRIHNNIAKGYVIKRDMTLEACYVAKVGNSFAHGETTKDAVADAEAKEMKRMPVEERIEKFIEKFGSLDSEHTGKEFYDWHHILTGSCRMGRDEFCKDNYIDLDKKYTVGYFLSITKNAYGGSVIDKILETYKSMGEIL